ncbi:MAG: hypothetical protein MUP97_04745 [Acidimicrobiia bacterium]|nr:hypothetical protein [Acidimicrobiia bacterium]
MKKDTPIVLAVATYADRQGAVDDYDAVKSAKRDGDFDHLAVAIVSKGADGHLDVERHDSTAKHGAWAGALMGGAILVAAPAAAVGAGAVGVGTAVGAGGGVSMAGLAGAGGLAGHFWRNIPKDKTREMGDLLDSGESGLIVVAVDKKGTDITPLLSRATKTVVDDTTKGDLDALYADAISQATS